MAETINREEYLHGQEACVQPESVRPGYYSIRRERLVPGDDRRFAVELFIRILDIDTSGGFPRFLVEDLDEWGTPTGRSEFVMDGDGTIISDGWEESGYLMGRFEPDEDTPFVTMADLMAPLAVRHEVRVPEPARRQAMPLPD